MRPVKSDVDFPALEKAVLAHWKANEIQEKGLALNKGKKRFVFYDGPPFATGLPHYGHILAGTLKDVVPRYWAMKGNYVERRWGWDCHGLPVEYEMEKELGFKGLHDIEKFGIANFNEACRGIVTRYANEWEKIISRTGRWADFKNSYRTMDTPFMESVWWVFKQLWEKGWVYEGYRVMPYSWRISTPLSNFEASLNYKEVQDPALTVKFKSLKKPRYFLAWTTTPWTLPANLALAVSEKIAYVEIEDAKTKEHLVLGKSRLASYYKSEDEYKILSEFTGAAIAGELYEPVFPFFKEKAKEGAFKVITAEHVTDTDGTGIVHTAPAHGEDDFQAAQKNGVPLVDATDNTGNFTSQIPELAGMNIKDADKVIIKRLKDEGKIFKHDTIVHNYAFCWRSDTPLMNKAISTWFVKIDPIKKKFVENNKKTHWVPEHLRDGRFGNWLESARDWNISRNRFWGTPLPVWRCDNTCGNMVCIGSIAELEKASGVKPTDLHKHFVDEIKIACPKCKKKMSRIPEVMDCWFESGSMPYAQAHYPFEDKKTFDENFPADFIAEGIDQTRGWFYTMTVLASALFDQPPSKHIMVNGLVLAEDGKKMSKRLKNYPDPLYVMDTYGADALRAYLMTSPASHAEDLRFSESGVKEVVRSVLLPFWNAYSFFVTYARADGWEAKDFSEKHIEKTENELDRWVISRLNTLVRDVEEKMQVYHLYEVVPEVLHFIDDMTNWYIRLNRRRFWSEEKSSDKTAAYSTLYYVLREFAKVLAPILPFITDEIYRNLTEGLKGAEESVHLAAYPTARVKSIDGELETRMGLIQTVVSMGRVLRNTHKLKTRQPLKGLLVITREPTDKQTIEKYCEIIMAELNVKGVSFSTEESKYVDLAAKPNAKVLGPRLGQRMKEYFGALKSLDNAAVWKLEKDGFIEVKGEKFTRDEIEIDRKPKQDGVIQTQGGVTVWLDTALEPALVLEGQAREVVNRVQKLRKDSGFEVTDRIKLEFETSTELSNAISRFSTYIKEETLADSITATSSRKQWSVEQDVDGIPLKLWVERL
jgi:isoleucyl-tRNA synthetase